MDDKEHWDKITEATREAEAKMLQKLLDGKTRVNSMIGCSVFDGNTKVATIATIKFDYNILPQNLPMSKGELTVSHKKDILKDIISNKKYQIMVIFRDVDEIETYQLTIKDATIQPTEKDYCYYFESKTLEDWKVL